MSLPKGFFIPPSARKTHVCRICGQEQYASDRIQHAKDCVAENHDRIAARHPHQALPAFTLPFDPERAADTKKFGRVR